MRVRLLLLNPKTVIIHAVQSTLILEPPCFQQFQLPAIPWAHGRNTCFPFEQGCLHCAWLLEGFVLMSCKKKTSWSVSDLRELHFKLDNIFMPLHVESDSCNHSGVQIFSCEQRSWKMSHFCVLLWRKNFIETIWRLNFLSGDWKKLSVTSWGRS